MQTILLSILFAAGLFVGLLACIRIGWRIGRKRLQTLGEDAQAGLGALDGAVFGLMGLLVAFTFTGAASRFDARRDLVTDHVNAITSVQNRELKRPSLMGWNRGEMITNHTPNKDA